MREEFIECQIWLKVLNKKDNVVTYKSRDRLLGSAYIDASGIAKSSSLKGSVRYGFEHLFFKQCLKKGNHKIQQGLGCNLSDKEFG